MTIVLTSIANNYLPKARVLAKSIKYHNPSWKFIVIISDKLIDETFHGNFIDEVIYANQLDIPNFNNWSFRYDTEELCTAVKPFAFKLLLKKYKRDNIFFIDPDIKIYSNLNFLLSYFKHSDILLTPHITIPEKKLNFVIDNEVSALKHGAFNLGFLGIKNNKNGLSFITWWAERLYHFCLKETENGFWTDQKWINLAPGLFDKVFVIRDPGCNLATWNASQRIITKKNDIFYANKSKLKFYHFTGYDNGSGKVELKKYIKQNSLLNILWDDYHKDLKLESKNLDLDQPFYSNFSSGEKISFETRKFFRENQNSYNKLNPYLKSNKYFGNSLSNNEQEYSSKNFIFYFLKLCKRVFKKLL